MSSISRTCYWCRVFIPYTISSSHYYCFECGRYTLVNTKEGGYYQGHICRFIKSMGPKVVLYSCKDCSNLFTLTVEEYDRDKARGTLRDYLNSTEFKEELDEEGKRFQSKGSSNNHSSTSSSRSSSKSYSEEDFEAFKRFITKKTERRAAARDRRVERRQSSV